MDDDEEDEEDGEEEDEDNENKNKRLCKTGSLTLMLVARSYIATRVEAITSNKKLLGWRPLLVGCFATNGAFRASLRTEHFGHRYERNKGHC